MSKFNYQVIEIRYIEKVSKFLHMLGYILISSLGTVAKTQKKKQKK